jgi:hypothetical protein
MNQDDKKSSSHNEDACENLNGKAVDEKSASPKEGASEQLPGGDDKGKVENDKEVEEAKVDAAPKLS